MIPIRIGLVVEGHGEVAAAPILFRRIAAEIDPTVALEFPHPIRKPRGSLIRKQEELERAVTLAALNVRPRGGVFVLLDSDDDCPAQLAPELLRRAKPAAMGLPLSVVLPEREFESWFLAAASSLAGQRGLPAQLQPPPHPERIRNAKSWLQDRMQGYAYSPTIDQPALAKTFDLAQARSSSSFDKCCRDLSALIQHFRS